MNLRDARIDLAGQVVALGKLQYPIDDNGYFVLNAHDCVLIDRRRGRNERLRLAAATAVRDPISGFMIAEEKEATVVVPNSLSSVIEAALRRSPPRPVRVSLSQQEDGLRWHSDSDPDSSKGQLLSDWELAITCDGELLDVQLSAALFGTEPIRVWEKNQIGHWSVINGIPPRIQISFCVDHATRVAAFHAIVDTSERPIAEAANPFDSTLATLKLASAPIDTMGQVFGVMRDGRLASLSFEYQRILITPHFGKKRLANGFLQCDTGHMTPSISLGVSIASLLRLLWRESKRMVSLELRDGTFGYLIQNRAFHESFRDGNQPLPQQMIQHALLKLRVGIEGLQLSYRLYITDFDVSRKNYEAGWLEDSLTVPWEILILRFPELLWHRGALLKEQLSQI